MTIYLCQPLEYINLHIINSVLCFMALCAESHIDEPIPFKIAASDKFLTLKIRAIYSVHMMHHVEL